MNIPLSDNDTTYRANQEKPLGKDKSSVEYSAEHKATDSINLGEIIQDFRNQIREDMHRVGNMILPEHLREPLMEALNPVIRISKNTITTAFDLLKKMINSETDDNISQNKCERVANDGDNEIIDLDMNAHKEAQMMNIPLSDNDTTYRANQEKPSGKDKSSVEYSAEHKATDSINLGEIIQEFRNQTRE